ncbi:hypothetical protein [Acidithiobacillus thiooxidans]|uniref:hypothetical protein n=1 Tax=Acidithiobacillus thiooxidans TaxID=930 RepID=UPI001C066607|nr:hypothetical protein [Acidithiobacillus thiooxidans]MBU2842833.1 hypothetical protein [Acidithiobacillus thiooxidans]
MKKSSVAIAVITILFGNFSYADIITNTGVPSPTAYQKQNDCGYCQPAQPYRKGSTIKKKSVTPKDAGLRASESSKDSATATKPHHKAS